MKRKTLTLTIMILGLSCLVVAQQSSVTDPGIDVATQLKQSKHHDKFILKYDKFKDYTVVAVKPMSLLSAMESGAASFARSLGNGPYHTGPTINAPTQFAVTAAFGFKGTRLNEEPKFGFVFITDSGGWLFLKDHKLYALIDGERLELGEGQHDGDVYLGGVSEQMIFDLTREQFEKFANGKSVEIQLGGFPRKLKTEQIEKLKTLLSLAPKGSATGKP